MFTITGPEQRQCERHVAVAEQQHTTDEFRSERDHVVMRAY